MPITYKPRIIHPEKKGVWVDVAPGIRAREVKGTDGIKHYRLMVFKKPYVEGFIHLTEELAHAKGYNQEGHFNFYHRVKKGQELAHIKALAVAPFQDPKDSYK